MMVGGSSSCQAGDKTGAAQLWPAEDNRTAWRPETADQVGDQHNVLQGKFYSRHQQTSLYWLSTRQDAHFAHISSLTSKVK